jgi:hypothetical protein
VLVIVDDSDADRAGIDVRPLPAGQFISADDVSGLVLPCRSPLQDDFAKWPILDQMTQGFAGIAKGIDPLDDWLDGSAEHQWDDVSPCYGDRRRRLGNREKPTSRARFQIRSVTSIVVLRLAE